MILVMLKVYPNQRLFDVILFDCASSVQKAGETFVAQFLMLIVTHETKHVRSLFLVQVFQQAQFQLMSKFVWIVSLLLHDYQILFF